MIKPAQTFRDVKNGCYFQMKGSSTYSGAFAGLLTQTEKNRFKRNRKRGAK